MKQASMVQRPMNRIDRVLWRIKRLWHYYPVYSLPELVLLTAVYANQAESDLPETCIEEFEDIAYPEGHLLHGTRNLEMGLDALEKLHENEALPPVPIQIATVGRVANYWRRHPQERLGELLTSFYHLAELDQEFAANGD
jgi:hypothetical protein